MSWLTGFGSARGNYKLLFHKRHVIAAAVKAYEKKSRCRLMPCAASASFDLAALCGAMMACADEKIPFYIDGFITATAWPVPSP